MRKGRYYIARVIKLGELNQTRLLDAIVKAPVVALGQFEWTITDVVDKRTEKMPYVFGNLAKYSKDGLVTIVDEPAKQQLQARAPNLLEASAPFVYLPQFSGLAFLHVWNGIQEDVFPRRFKSIIEAAYDNFFVDCTIEPVADYRAFLDRLKSLDRITELSAKVHPPNPLFGRLWGGLDKYVKKRKAEEVRWTSLKSFFSNAKVPSATTKVLKPRLPELRAVDSTELFVLTPTITTDPIPRACNHRSSPVLMNASGTFFSTTCSAGRGARAG